MKILGVSLVFLLLSGTAPLAQEQPLEQAVVLDIKGPIGPAISEFAVRQIARAGTDGRKLVILRMDTPGGLDTAMREIIKAVLTAPVPVVSWVAPSGARAASAGTYILYASHIAMMAPATNLGAATPIPIGPGALPGGDERDRPGADEPKSKEPKAGDDAQGGSPEPASAQTAMARKVVNDAVAYIRSLAELRGRNADWAEQAVRRGVSLSAEAALKERVIDGLAADMEALLHAIDGRTVDVNGTAVTLKTEGWRAATVELDWRTQLLAVITNPNVAYVLMLLGIYGLLFELYSPGAMAPGVVGAISLLLALYAFQVLPVNYAGVALVLAGIAMMVVELLTPSFGVIGIGGVIAFLAGSVFLFDTESAPGFEVSLPLVLTVGLTASGLFCATIVMALRQRRRPVVSGREEMIGSLGEAMESFAETGRVRAHGEIWSARASHPVHAGQSVRITNLEGLVLEIEPIREEA